MGLMWQTLMNMQTLVHIGLLYFVTEVKLFILIVSVHVAEEVKEIFGNKNIIANTFLVQPSNSVMWVLLHWIHWKCEEC